LEQVSSIDRARGRVTSGPRTALATEMSRLRPCPLCGSQEFSSVFDPIKRCKACRLCFVNPLGPYRGENETEDYFLNDYLPLHLANRENSLVERRSYLSAIRRRFDVSARPRLLDVGCALGFMLHEAKAAGWDATGVETSEFAAKYATEHTGCTVHTGTVEDAALHSDSFDAVTLMDVIEHVAEPRTLLCEIYRILRPGGMLFIVTPNFGSLFVWLYGLRAYGVWPDQHVIYFQPSTMDRMLRDVGFKRVITGSKDFYAENLRQLLRRGTRSGSGNIKAAFSPQRSLGKMRNLVNHLLMFVPVGDKLIAFAQK
jgi:2-polyprenyl-3-methyl-5-hydroxy-6-metoxy-1,4-benzoquinol methylase